MAHNKLIVKNDSYFDSVFLMRTNGELKKIPGIIDVFIGMGTEHNRKIMAELSYVSENVSALTPNDLIIAVSSETEEGYKTVEAKFEELLKAQKTQKVQAGYMPGSLEGAFKLEPELNMAVISLPGVHAAYEVEKCLEKNLNVLLFSDNVSIEDEIRLKDMAVSKGLLMMGPDCGTAIINGVPLGFANKIRPGDIGIIGASGTGIQELTAQIHRYGGGITNAIGLGGRDLSEKVGGKMMFLALDMLERHEKTKVIVLLSKPPAEMIARKILERAKKIRKPVVVYFINSPAELVKEYGFETAVSLEDAAIRAVELSMKKKIEFLPVAVPPEDVVSRYSFRPGQKYLRGLFSGGTLCDEAMHCISNSMRSNGINDGIYSNTPLNPAYKLKNPDISEGNTIIDLGDDYFTVGKPHPMIDFTLRNERLLLEARDPEVKIILFDLVLGYGANPDPAGAIIPAIQAAGEICKKDGREICFVASVCGTDEDCPDILSQTKALKEAGVEVMGSNIRASLLAFSLL